VRWCACLRLRSDLQAMYMSLSLPYPHQGGGLGRAPSRGVPCLVPAFAVRGHCSETKTRQPASQPTRRVVYEDSVKGSTTKSGSSATNLYILTSGYTSRDNPTAGSAKIVRTIVGPPAIRAINGLNHDSPYRHLYKATYYAHSSSSFTLYGALGSSFRQVLGRRGRKGPTYRSELGG